MSGLSFMAVMGIENEHLSEGKGTRPQEWDACNGFDPLGFHVEVRFPLPLTKERFCAQFWMMGTESMHQQRIDAIIKILLQFFVLNAKCLRKVVP